MASVVRSQVEARWWNTSACADEVCQIYSEHCPGSFKGSRDSKEPHPRGDDLAGAIQLGSASLSKYFHSEPAKRKLDTPIRLQVHHRGSSRCAAENASFHTTIPDALEAAESS